MATATLLTQLGPPNTALASWVTNGHGPSGWDIPNHSTAIPASVTGYTRTGGSLFTWAASSADARAVQKIPPATDRIASTIFTASSFTIDFNCTTADTLVNLYFLDWDSIVRRGTVEIMDRDNADAVLVTTNLNANFNGGVGLFYEITGHVRVKVTYVSGGNVTMSGIFFDDGTIYPDNIRVTKAGAEFFVADAVDANIRVTTAGVEFFVADGTANEAPEVEISTATAQTHPEGTLVTLEATATDEEDGDLSAEIVWESDIDGILGTGASIEVILSPGVHTITASVEDSEEEPGSDSITVTIEAADVDPELTAPVVVATAVSPTDAHGTITGTPPATATVVLWRLEVDGEGITTYPAITIDGAGLWRERPFPGQTQGASGTMYAKYGGPDGVGPEGSDTFDLPDEAIEEDEEPDPGPLGVLGTIEWEDPRAHVWRTAAWPFTTSRPGELPLDNDGIKEVVTLKKNGVVIAVGDSYPSGAPNPERVWRPTFLLPGQTYVAEGQVLYADVGYRVTTTRTLTLAVPSVLDAPKFYQSSGPTLIGGTAGITWYSPDGYLIGGTDTIEYTRSYGDSGWTALASGLIADTELSGSDVGEPSIASVMAGSHQFDSTALPDGRIRFRVKRVTEEDGDSEWRLSPWYWIENETAGFDRRGVALDLADWDIIGSPGAEAGVTLTEDDNDVPIFRLQGPGVFILMPKAALVGQPRTFDITADLRNSTSDGTGGYGQYFADMHTAMGVGAYAGENYEQLEMVIAPSFGATGTALGQGEGNMQWSHWDSGLRLGKGVASLQARQGAGTVEGVTPPSLGSNRNWWHRNYRYPKPIYQIGAAFEKSAETLAPYRAHSLLHGPESDGDAATDLSVFFGALEIPCGSPCVVVRMGTAATVDFYGAHVHTYASGDCADYDDEPGAPCLLELTVYEDDGETIEFQITTDHNWLGESGEAKPYLKDPLQYGQPYGEQEVDFAEGTASLTSVVVQVIDPPTVQGDKDSGWMTFRKELVAGRRNRLRRFISVEDGWVTVADGPGGFPQLMPTYSGFEWEIRDTREKERRLRAFLDSGSLSVYPPGLYNQNWGATYDGEYLLEAVSPQVGTFSGNVDTSAGEFHFSGSIPYTLPMKQASQVTFTNDDQTEGYFPNVVILWRYVGDTDAQWRELRNMPYSFVKMGEPWLFLTAASFASVLGDDITVIRLNFDGSVPHEEPTDSSSLEVFVLYAGPSNSAFPFYIDELTAGQFLKNLYDGLYSPKDAITGEVIPTGIRYDEDALLAMTTPVRLRIQEPVKDIRRWAERHIYRPLGYAPALDFDGRISPVSQVIPTDPAFLASLVTIDDAIAQGVPGHAPGENVINVLNLKYQRAYSDPVNSTEIDGLVLREIEYEYRDDLSIYRHGERDLSIETDAFVAVGDEEADAVESEVGAALWADRRDNLVINRRVNGTDLAVVPVMRIATFDLRAGSWVRCRLSWIPNGTTRRRHLNHLAQVLGIKDLNCSWREVTMELVKPWPLTDDEYS